MCVSKKYRRYIGSVGRDDGIERVKLYIYVFMYVYRYVYIYIERESNIIDI